MSQVTIPTAKLTRKDFMSDQEVRWCPGCGDYSILAQMQKVLPELAIDRAKMVFISGIGCASRFPYYMNTYGFHTIHGRAPAIATGLKISRPELDVWVVTGDGDGLSIGGNHLIHALRRNIDIKILLFNNRIYGLTKGQYSPTSELGKVTKSTPFGSLDYPLSPVEIALGAEATFVARSVDVEIKHLQDTLKRAHEHTGSAFIEILQNCNVFNDGAWEPITNRATKADHQLILEHGKPLIFGKNNEKGIRLGKDMNPEIVNLGDGVDASELLVHDETNPGMAYILSRLGPQFPTPIGVFRTVKRMSYDEGANAQIETAKKRLGPGDLEAILNRGDTWVVK
ncbi:MAG: 2-oxoacid:ferredoxin oxidoreductase subunit beta [candidate division NC10 bacterium]|nr:2-oxoacid:ferredoxin oxidoreductase subunit beta [candidate division NC10 bacterium]